LRKAQTVSIKLYEEPKKNGMREVRVEFHEGKHSLYHPQFIEALGWFEQQN